jgi:hypothetical protein
MNIIYFQSLTKLDSLKAWKANYLFSFLNEKLQTLEKTQTTFNVMNILIK